MATETRRPGRLAGTVVVALLLALAAWTVAALQPPSPAPGDAPADRFSATRAFGHVQRIAAQTHVAGSPANDEVIDYLADTLRGLGLDTRIQNAVGTWEAEPGSAEMARVRNVVAVLPGSDPTGRLFLMSHHDSVETGPGAADAASGVAGLLESARALTTGPQLRNDVVVVITDAEEACLCGAEAFAAVHPLATGGGVVLNFEARGTSGPPIMFETSRGNAELAAVFADAAEHPVASSFAVEVYRALPNDTDFSVLLGDGDFTGLNTAFIDGAAGYHTPQDVPERLDRGTLQALGDNALALTRALGERDLGPLATPAAADATYFPVAVPGVGLVRYDGGLVLPLAIGAAVGVLLLVWALHRRRVSALGRTAAGAALALLPLAGGPLAVLGMWKLLVLVRPGYVSMLDPWRPGWYRLAAVALVAAVVLLWYALLRRRVGPAALATGGLVWLAVLGVVLALVAPGGAYLATWPALAGVVGALLALTGSPVGRVAGVLVAGGIATLVLAPTVALFFPALGLRGGYAPALVATLLAMALLPAFELIFPAEDARRAGGAAALVPATALVLVVAAGLIGLRVDRFDAEHPVPSQLVYAFDTDLDQAWWASTETRPGEYTARYVEGRATLPVDFPYLAGREVATGPAGPADLAPPAVEVTGDRAAGERRELAVRVTPQRPGVRLLVLELQVEGGSVLGGRVEGRAVPQAALGESRLWVTFHAPPPDGVEASFVVTGGGTAQLRVVDGSDGLSGLPGFEPRPEHVDAAGTHSSDLVVVAETTPLG